MDDSMDSVQDETSGIELYRQLSTLWEKAGMHARKWLSNSAAVLEKIPEEDRALEVDLDKGNLPSLKTLGVLLLAKEDVFTFRASAPKESFQLTKRSYLKKIASLFDPMGFLAPYTIQSKILLQEMWASGYGWDELLDPNLSQKAKNWFGELTDLDEIRVPRCLRVRTEGMVTSGSLHTFSDASEEAYGAVSYIRYQYSSGAISLHFVAAKVWVTPLSSISIPRLELMGAVMGLRQTTAISAVLDVEISQVVLWTDFNPKKRWRRIQELVRHFWHRWLKEWLPALSPRGKWFSPKRDFQNGDVVLVISPETPRGQWPLGKVIEVYPGNDGHVRVAKIQVGKNVFVRPVTRLCPLEHTSDHRESKH